MMPLVSAVANIYSGPRSKAATHPCPALKELRVQKPGQKAGPFFSMRFSLGPEGGLAIFSFLYQFCVLESYPVPKSSKLPAIPHGRSPLASPQLSSRAADHHQLAPSSTSDSRELHAHGHTACPGVCLLPAAHREPQKPPSPEAFIAVTGRGDALRWEACLSRVPFWHLRGFDACETRRTGLHPSNWGK